MLLKTFRLLGLVFVVLCLGPSLAHLLELPNKLNIAGDAYLTVQQNYRGWALLGTVVASALVSTLVLVVLERGHRRTFVLSLAAFLCVVGAQVVFWTWTYPANQATNNWTMLPQGWEALRRQWEYSHAVGAVFNLAAFLCLTVSVVGEGRDRGRV